MKIPALLVATSLFFSAFAPRSHARNEFAEWWDGKTATGDWFGARETLDHRGVRLSGEWKANFLWDVDGGLQRRFGYDDEWKFRLNVDFAKLSGWSAIEGLTAYADVRYRGGAGVNKWVGSSNFAPSTFQGGRLWRFLNAYATYTTPELFGIKNLFTVSGGWQNPADQFIKQPLSKLFLNNTITSSRGLSTFQWGASYSAWGGYLEVKPADWYYAKGGLYVAIPQATNPDNHGLYFAGYRPNPNLNGLYFIGESGLTPKFGPTKLPGRYAAGFIYYGSENTSYFGEPYDQKLGFYWQADQMIFRESAPANSDRTEKSPPDGKDFKSSPEKPERSDQGLSFFSLINYTPKYNNPMPYYFQAGLVYKGLLPGRDADQLGTAMAYGNYSYYKQISDRESGKPAQVYEAALEFFYRIQLNDWAYAQPDVQYIIRPGGAGLVANATVIGFQLGVLF